MSDKQDKTLDASPRRLEKAREEGNVSRSREILSVGILMFSVGTLAFGAPLGFNMLKKLMVRVFTAAASTPLTVISAPRLLMDLGLQVTAIMAPFFGVLIVTGIAFNILQSGWNVTFKPLMPKGNRINPLQGMKRIFSSRGLFDLLKTLIKIALVGPLAYRTIADHLQEIMMLHTLPLDEILTTSTGWILALLAKMIMALLVLAGVDFGFEKWRYKNDMKMSHQEMKEEVKEQEGDAQIKSKRRQKAAALARRPRLDHAILKADVVVTNPTHYAVALRYDPAEGAAPRVLAKGIRKRALRIKELALLHDIPTIEDRPLARALYNTVPEEQEIPEELYPAVAAVLAEIYRKKRKQSI